MKITKEFTFDSAHKLINYKGKCEHLHGHTYKLHITVEGDIKDDGLVIDFVILKHLVKDNIIEKLDHKYLNDIFENPSAENIAVWIWDNLKEVEKHGVKMYEVKLWESPTSFVTYNG